jgi:hypothetical protein
LTEWNKQWIEEHIPHGRSSKGESRAFQKDRENPLSHGFTKDSENQARCGLLMSRNGFAEHRYCSGCARQRGRVIRHPKVTRSSGEQQFVPLRGVSSENRHSTVLPDQEKVFIDNNYYKSPYPWSFGGIELDLTIDNPVSR